MRNKIKFNFKKFSYLERKRTTVYGHAFIADKTITFVLKSADTKIRCR